MEQIDEFIRRELWIIVFGFAVTFALCSIAWALAMEALV